MPGSHLALARPLLQTEFSRTPANDRRITGLRCLLFGLGFALCLTSFSYAQNLSELMSQASGIAMAMRLARCQWAMGSRARPPEIASRSSAPPISKATQAPPYAARLQAAAMPPLAEVVVDQANPFKGATIKPCAPPPPEIPVGEVLVHIVKFVMTGNTLTYATMGKLPVFATWEHFPYEDTKFAKSPAWGMGVVTASRSPGVAVGSRIFGYFPMSPWVTLQPEEITAQNFTDGASHRQKLLAPYRTYALRPLNSTADEEDLGLADALLFSTGWGIAQQVRLQQNTSGATAMLLISASSRTALTAAFSARHEKLGYKVIGLTSKANEAFVQSTGLYDKVFTYDNVKALPQERVAVYDMAGSAKVNEELRAHYGSNMVEFGMVGGTHIGAGGNLTELAGPLSSLPFPFSSILSPLPPLIARTPLSSALSPLAPILHPFTAWMAYGGSRPAFFLVFEALEAAGKEYGPVEVQKKIDEAREAYVRWKLPDFKASRCFGAEATLKVWQKAVASEADPGITYICSLWPTADLAEPNVKLSNL